MIPSAATRAVLLALLIQPLPLLENQNLFRLLQPACVDLPQAARLDLVHPPANLRALIKQRVVPQPVDVPLDARLKSSLIGVEGRLVGGSRREGKEVGRRDLEGRRSRKVTFGRLGQQLGSKRHLGEGECSAVWKGPEGSVKERW